MALRKQRSLGDADLLSLCSRWPLILLVAAVLALRLPLVYDQPYTDEGIYAATAYFDFLAYTGALDAPGWWLPRDGTLGLYSLLSSWVFFLPLQPLTALRLVDAAVAAWAVCMVYRFMRCVLDSQASALAGALLLALALNHPLFINAGFKNPIPLALGLLALAAQALYLGGAGAAARAGLLAGLAVLFREPLLPMAAVLALYALHRNGWRGLAQFSLTGTAAALVLLGLNTGARGEGGLTGLVEAYASFDAAILPLTERLQVTVEQGRAAAQVLLPLLPLALLGLLGPWLSARFRQARTPELYGLALLLTLCPLPEIFYKAAFAYHFSQAAFGLSLFAAMGFRGLRRTAPGNPHQHKGAALASLGLAAALSIALALPYARQYYWQAAAAARFIPVMLHQNWDSPAVAQSLYLRAAAAVRKSSAADARMMTEFNSMVLFPLTLRQPTFAGAGIGSRVSSRMDKEQGAQERSTLLATPPDVLVLIPRQPDGEGVHPFLRELSTRYKQVLTLPAGLSPYGGWTTEIYIKKDS